MKIISMKDKIKELEKRKIKIMDQAKIDADKYNHCGPFYKAEKKCVKIDEQIKKLNKSIRQGNFYHQK